FVKDDDRNYIYQSLMAGAAPEKVDPLIIEITMRLYHHRPHQQIVSNTNTWALHEWLNLNRRKGANWRITYDIQFEDFEGERLTDLLPCAMMEYRTRINDAVKSDVGKGRPKSKTGKALQEAYHSAATAFILEKFGVEELSALQRVSLLDLLVRVLPEAGVDGFECIYCRSQGAVCSCGSCSAQRITAH
ncbi:hypothetical protein LTR95_014785, partial [Oleoguttula sp. CCFEE 5521]